MPLSLTQVSVNYVGNAATVDFPTTFRFLSDEDLLVQKSLDAGVTWTDLVQDTDYTVAGAGDDEPGGTVTTLFTLGAGDLLRIERQTPVTQLLELQTSGPLPARSLVTALDKLTMIAQEQAARLDALEAGSSPVTLTASKVTKTFVVSDPPENSFPLAVACVGTPTGVALVRVEDLTDGTTNYYGLGELKWDTPVANQFTLRYAPGLVPGHNTRLTFLVITL